MEKVAIFVDFEGNLKAVVLNAATPLYFHLNMTQKEAQDEINRAFYELAYTENNDPWKAP